MGSIGNLNATGNGVRIQNNGYVGNYNGTNSTMVNNGHVENAHLMGTAQTQNNGFMNNVHALNNTFTQNNGTMNNVKLDAFNNERIGFQNNGVTNNLDADVFSTQNNGFIDIQNNGLVKNANLFDNVPWQPPVRRDLITYNNTGTTQNLTTGTAGIGQVDVNNWGNIWNLNASGNTRVWNG